MRFVKSPDGETHGMIMGTAEWKPTVAAVRDAVLAFRLVAPDYCAIFPAHMVSHEMRLMRIGGPEMENIAALAREAVTKGRLIDFGFLPNEFMMATSKRAGPAYQKQALNQPFRDSWMFRHEWERGIGVYLVNPTPTGMEVIEFQPMLAEDTPVLAVGDRGLFIFD